MHKTRLDQLLVERGLADDLSQAKAKIMAGGVIVGNHRVDKPGTHIDPASELRLKGGKSTFASRAGDKLAAALDAFELDPTGRIALDLGASTGGFTDCLLQAGVARVYAVDVGKGLLDAHLRANPRVTVMEGQHAIGLTRAMVPEPVDLITADVSFTSLRRILLACFALAREDCESILLFKPQFEVPRHQVEAGGLVSNRGHREAAITEFASWLSQLGYSIINRLESPIRGRKSGNIETLLHVRKDSGA